MELLRDKVKFSEVTKLGSGGTRTRAQAARPSPGSTPPPAHSVSSSPVVWTRFTWSVRLSPPIADAWDLVYWVHHSSYQTTHNDSFTSLSKIIPQPPLSNKLCHSALHPCEVTTGCPYVANNEAKLQKFKGLKKCLQLEWDLNPGPLSLNLMYLPLLHTIF